MQNLQNLDELLLKVKSTKVREDDEHGRFQVNKQDYKSILVRNIPFLFTCDEINKLVCKKNHSIIINDGIITKVAPSSEIDDVDFDVVYDAGKRGGIVVTPGFINTHSHIHMYLMRSSMMLDEEETLEKTIAAMGEWQKNETDETYLCSAIGDITEQQKSGITTTLTHGPNFHTAEAAAKASAHNLINAISAVSNSKKENTPEMVEEILKKKNEFYSTPAIALHYLYKTTDEILKKISRIQKEYNALLTFHMSESQKVVEESQERLGMSEFEILKKYDFLNENSIASHAIHIKDDDISEMVNAKIGIAHLPTSNTIHKSGVFPFWKFRGSGGFNKISLGTDSVVSKNRLDLLSEAYQTRITHLYSRTIKFGSLFKMMTVNGACVLNLKDRGKIVPGMRADLAFWKLKDRGFIPFDQENPMTLLGNLITHGGRMVRDLMINGKFVIKSRHHQMIDESKLLEVIQEKHMEMRDRVKKEFKEK
ncbi:MAG: amidohydrolase family protein [Candidatus Moranbacteria bacterium]|nr:amidohydrolase family protein [Candidatus Moranbacteria bacterium]